MAAPALGAIWRFARGDMPAAEFEAWAYRETDLERVLGAALYLETVSTDFRSRSEVYEARRRLANFASTSEPPACGCVLVADTDVVDMGHEEWLFRTLEQTRDRGKPHWWLSTYRCRQCGQPWLVAQEEHHNDVFCLYRMSKDEENGVLQQNDWPAVFDEYASLLALRPRGAHTLV